MGYTSLTMYWQRDVNPVIAIMYSSTARASIPSPVRNTPSPSYNSSQHNMFDLSASRVTLEDPRNVFSKLGEDFGIHKDVTKFMISSCQMQSLDDFRFYFANDDDIATMVARVRPSGHVDEEDYLNKGIAVSRVRQAWDGIKKEFLKRERGNEEVETADLDEPLPSQDLKNLKRAHWKRYKQHYPAYIMCADQVVSRISRELSKRALQVQAMSAVRTLTHQVTTAKKKRKVGTDLYTYDTPELNLYLDHESYLDQMFTYFIAMSIAGCINRGKPPPGGETMESCSSQFVEILMDVLTRYWWRATHSSKLQPWSVRFVWLQEKDVQERSEWAEEFNKSEAPLGEVILRIMDKRDAHWYPPVVRTNQNDVETLRQQFLRQSNKQQSIESKLAQLAKGQGRGKGTGNAPVPGDQGSEGGGNGGRGKGGGNPPGGNAGKGGGGDSHPPGTPRLFGFPVAFKMKDGTAICRAFQKGECKNAVDATGKGCRDGRHQCAVLINKEGTRVCGGNHSAKNHRR